MRYTTAFWLFSQCVRAFLAAHTHTLFYQYCRGSDIINLLDDTKDIHPRVFQELLSRFVVYGYLQLVIDHRVLLPGYIAACRGLIYSEGRYSAYKIDTPITLRIFGRVPAPLVLMDRTPFAHRVVTPDSTSRVHSHESGLRALCWLLNLPLEQENVTSQHRPRAYRYALAALLLSGQALDLDSLGKTRWFDTINGAARRVLELIHHNLLQTKERFLAGLSPTRHDTYARISDESTWLSTADIMSILPADTISLPALPEPSLEPDSELESSDDLVVTAIHHTRTSSIATVRYLVHDRNHWMAAFLDTATRTLFVADSLSDSMDPRHVAMVTDDLKHNTSTAYTIVDISSHAQEDVSSCGVYAFLFLMTLPRTHRDLVQVWTRTNIALGREQMALLNAAQKRQNVTFTLDVTLCWSYAQAVRELL